jgi:hypothetical protein
MILTTIFARTYLTYHILKGEQGKKNTFLITIQILKRMLRDTCEQIYGFTILDI